MNIVTRFLLELQEMSLLSAGAARGLFKKPRYIPEAIAQMDAVTQQNAALVEEMEGFESMPIVANVKVSSSSRSWRTPARGARRR